MPVSVSNHNHQRLQLSSLTLTPTTSSNFDSTNRLSVNNSFYDSNTAGGNGNQTATGGYSFVYDGENRIVAAYQTAPSLPLSSTAYVYDGEGQRVQKISCNPGTNPCTATSSGATITTYVYDAFGNLAAEYGGSAGSPCGTPTCYLTEDHLGSTRLVTDSSGSPATVRRYDYLPFGEELPGGTTSAPGVNGRLTAMGYTATPDGSDPKFTGQYRDPETGLDWFNVRHMSGAQGRFQSVDPANAGASLGDPQSWNGYAYVGNNPLTYTDPSGMFLSAGGTEAVGAASAGPIGAAIGGAIDLGIGLS